MIGSNRPAMLYGLAVFTKRTVLCGEDSHAHIYRSDVPHISGPNTLLQGNRPTAVVEILDPMVLSSKVRESDPCGDGTVNVQIPDTIRELFDENNALKEEKTGLEEQLAAAKAENEQLKAQLDTARTEQDRTAASLESALKQKNTAAVRAGEELEAYRRAERTERMARERAEQMYRQASGVIADATTRVDETAGQIGEMTDRVLKQLLELQNAVSGSKQALQDAAATLYAIRPETEE